MVRKSGYCPVFSVSKKKLKKLKKHCILQRVCKAVGREQKKRGCRQQREKCFTAQNREESDCQGA